MSRSWTNGEIANLLAIHAELLAIAGENAFRARAFSRAADTIRVLPERVDDIAAAGQLRAIPGVGEGIAAAIEQILSTGTFEAHRDLTKRFPEALVSLVKVPGIGAKTAQRLYRELGIDSLTALEEAASDDRIAKTKGLGPRVEATVRAGLAAIQRRTGRTPLGVARPLALAFVDMFAAARPMDEISIAGSTRRWETTVGDLDFVVGTNDPAATLAAIQNLPIASGISAKSENHIRLGLTEEIKADIIITSTESFGSVLLLATGNAAHLERLGPIPVDVPDETEIYAIRGLPWIPPELRQGNQEFTRWQEIPKLVTLDSINGEFHAHTRWSDGAESVLVMAEAAAGRGYRFLGITDHSHGLGVAGGLNVERLIAQRAEIEALDLGLDIVLLPGAEVEVHSDGALDFDDDTLARLDVVVASLHTGLRQPSDKLTDRLIRVLRNPNVDIIAHPSGRLIERREGGDFDWPRVFSVAAETGTALEINADPARLDLEPRLAEQAASAGCLITINCDAHHPDGFANMEYGVAMARRAWLEPANILNCWSRQEVLDWLAQRR